MLFFEGNWDWLTWVVAATCDPVSNSSLCMFICCCG